MIMAAALQFVRAESHSRSSALFVARSVLLAMSEGGWRFDD
jgi:hypothetical protein